MNGKYPALRMVAAFHKLAGVVTGIVGLFIFLRSVPHINSLASSSVIAFGIILGGVFLFGFGNLIDLMMGIELNTRESARLARQSAGGGMPV